MNDLDDMAAHVRSALHGKFPERTETPEPDLSFTNSQPTGVRRAFAAAGVASLAVVVVVAISLIAIHGQRPPDSGNAAAHSPSPMMSHTVSPSTEPSVPRWARRCMPTGGKPVHSLVGLDLNEARLRAKSEGLGIWSVSKDGRCIGPDPLNLYNQPVAVAIDAHERVLIAVKYPPYKR